LWYLSTPTSSSCHASAFSPWRKRRADHAATEVQNLQSPSKIKIEPVGPLSTW
jgi:hypothetical protein